MEVIDNGSAIVAAGPKRRSLRFKETQLLAGLVFIDRGECWTSTVNLARTFGKDHWQVLRSVRDLAPVDDPRLESQPRNADLGPIPCPKNGARNSVSAADSAVKTDGRKSSKRQRKSDFEDAFDRQAFTRATAQFWRDNILEETYIGQDGKEHPVFMLSEEGFMFIATGFTGEKARFYKMLYVQEFRRMRSQLVSISLIRSDPRWHDIRERFKENRKSLEKTIDCFVQYAIDQGSKNAGWYFADITMAVYRALFNVDDKVYKALRDRMTVDQLPILGAAETAAVKALEDGMDAELPYKDVFTLVKERMEKFVECVGVSEIPADMMALFIRPKPVELPQQAGLLF